MSTRGRPILAAIVGVAALSAASGLARADDLILAVTVDGRPQPGFGDFVERDGRLFARPEDLAKVGVVVPADTPAADGLVALDAVPGLTYAFDFAEQTVDISVDFSLLAGSSVRMGGAAGPTTITRSATALAFAYDATASEGSDGELRWGSFLGGTLSTPWGVGETTGFVRGGTDSGDRTDTGLVRLDSGFETYLPDSMIALRAGDAITGGLTWTRPVRFGGLLVQRDFAIRPDLVTTPLAGFDGTAEVPSSVDVLINGIRHASYDVEPGPFHIADVPIVTGAGQVSLVVRDALGRETIQNFDYFASPKLLADGLFDWSAGAGWLRRDYGTDSFAYGPWIASATARWGMTSWLTLEGHAETASGLVSGGAGIVAGFGVFGAASAFAAASREDSDIASNGRGTRFGAGYDWSNGWLNLSASAEITDPGFADIASLSGSDYPSSSWRAGAGLNLDAYGSLGFSYVERRYRDRDDDAFLTASYSLPLPGSLYFGVSALAQPDRDEWQLSASLSLPLGGTMRGSARTRFDQDGWAETSATLADASHGLDDLGWRLDGATGRTQDTLDGQATWRTAYGDVTAQGNAESDATGDDSWAVRVDAAGAIVASGAGVAFSRPLDGAFAIVDVGGVSGVTVRDGNRVVGETGWLGPVIVPELRPWEENTIAIDALDVPMNVALDGDRQVVVPAGRTAVAVEFAPRTASSVVVVLVDESGQPLPQGAAVSADGVPAAFPVGYDGEAYLEDVGESFTVEVTGLWGRCEVLVTMPPEPEPRLGPLTCRKTS